MAIAKRRRARSVRALLTATFIAARTAAVTCAASIAPPVLVLIPAVAVAQSDTSHHQSTASVGLGDVILLVSSDPRLRGALDEAVAMWRGCPQFGVGFPRLETIEKIESADVRPGERPGRRVTVALGSREHPGRGSRCGTFQGSSIVLHRRTVDELGSAHYCGALEATLAHEIGHVLGVEHTALEAEPGDQNGQVMTGTIMPNIKRPRRVMTLECSAVDLHWMTSLELAGARSLGLAPPESVSGRSLVEAAAAWHEAVAMGLVDFANPAGRALASKRKPPVAVP